MWWTFSARVELPYLVLWRIPALVLGTLVGGLHVLRYLGDDVPEQAEAARRALEEARRSLPSA